MNIMNKKIILLVVAMVTCMAYAGQKNRVKYEFPANMPDAVKEAFTEQCDKGLALYEINCAACHNTKSGKRSIIPDFAQEQLIGYELRVKNAKHESSISETTVTAEELGLIMTFLTYKKKNN